MPKPGFPFAAAVLASATILFGAPCAAQRPTPQAWTRCQLLENLPGDARLLYQGIAEPGQPPSAHVSWFSGPGGRIRVNLSFGRGPTGAPIMGAANYAFESDPRPGEYKFVFDFNGAAPQASLPLGSGFGKATPSLAGSFDASRNAGLMEGFARARRVTAIVYEGDRPIAQTTFDLAPDRREAGLDAFRRRVQANDPGVCRAGSGPAPPLPVPPILHPHR